MPDGSTLVVFIVAAVILLVVPGPAVMYIVARSIDQGRLAGIVSVLGIEVGTFFHIGAAALGISALLMTSALAFEAVKYLGAAYLVYLGIHKLFFEKDDPAAIVAPEPQKLSRIFVQGAVVNVLNPKTALFFFAFLPQFADPVRGPVAVQILFLGLLFVAMATCSDSLYALLAGSLGQWLKDRRAFLRGQRYFAGTVYVALGVLTALSGSESH
jgi:threonine/homoserine/homoserine lactone efflux protein